MALAERAGLHAIPTGIEHGTVTVVADKTAFEVTTLRRDIETFGRRAKVTFTTDWHEDAMRRDFTMNALYCDESGKVHDPLGGYGDLKGRARTLHRRRARAHSRGLSAHSALLPLRRAVRRRGGARRRRS